MSTTTAPTLDQKSKELFKLLMPHRTSDVMQRINLLSVQRTEKKLPDYINGDATEDEKVKFLDELIAIVQEQKWDSLPAAPQGQTTANPKPAAPAAPKPAAKATPKPAPTAEAPAAQPAPVSPAAPAPAVPSTEVVTLPPAEPAAAPDPIAVIHEQLAKLSAVVKAQPVGQVNQADVRKAVRLELADIFGTIAEVLRK